MSTSIPIFSQETIDQLNALGINAESAMRALGQTLEKLKQKALIPNALEFVKCAKNHLQDIEVTEKKQPNFARFQNNFKRRGR